MLAAAAPCPRLLPAGSRGATRLAPGQITYINDGIALHAVRCPEDSPAAEGGVTLHLYAPPIRR